MYDYHRVGLDAEVNDDKVSLTPDGPWIIMTRAILLEAKQQRQQQRVDFVATD